MMTLLCATILLGVAPAGEFQDKFPDVPSTYGYDAYAAAGKLVQTREARLYADWSPNQYEKLVAQPGQEPSELLAAAKRLDGMSLLEVRREFANKYEKAISFVRHGNYSLSKTQFPKQRLSGTDLINSRRVSRLLTAAAYVAFADGKPEIAVRNLVDLLRYSHEIARQDHFGASLGFRAQLDAFRMLQENQARIPSSEWETIDRTCRAILEDVSALKALVSNEAQMAVEFARLLSRPTAEQEGDVWGDYLVRASELDEDVDKLFEWLTSASAGEKAALIERVAADSKDWSTRTLKMLDGPEGDWKPLVGEDEVPQVKTLGDAQRAVLLLSRLPNSIIPMAQLKRTQFRLLRLYANIETFRWRHDRLPNTLSEAAPEDLRLDPLSRRPFIYLIEGNGYKLASHGDARFGEITLTGTEKWAGRARQDGSAK